MCDVISKYSQAVTRLNKESRVVQIDSENVTVFSSTSVINLTDICNEMITEIKTLRQESEELLSRGESSRINQLMADFDEIVNN